MAVDPNFGWVRSLIQGNSTANLADTKWPTEVVGSTAGTDYIGLANGSVTVSPPGAIGAYDFDTSTSPTYIYIFRQAVIANNPTWVPGARIMETEDVVILCGSSPGTLVAESRNGLAILSMSLRVPIIGQYKLELTSWTAWGGDYTTYVAYVDRTAGGFYGALSSAFTIGSDYGGPSAFQPKTGFTKLGGTAGGQSLVDTPTFTLTKNTTVAGYLPLSAAVTASANVGQDYLGYTDTYADLVGQKVYISSGGTANYLVTLDTVPGSSNGRSFTPSSLVSGTVTLRVGRGTTQSPYFTASVKVAGMTVVQAASVAAQSLVAQVNAAYAGQGLPAASAVTGLQTTSESISKSFTSTYPAGFASGVQVHPAGVYSGTLSGTRTKEYTAVTLNLPILENGMSWGPVGVSTADLVLEPGLPPKTSDFTDGPVIYGGAYGRGAGVRGVVTLTVTGAQNAANGASVLSGIAYTPSAADATGFFAAQFDSIATPVFSSSSGSSTVVLTTKTPMAFSQSLLDAARVGYRAATGSGIDRLYGFRVTLAKSSTDAITLPWPTTSIPPAIPSAAGGPLYYYPMEAGDTFPLANSGSRSVGPLVTDGAGTQPSIVSAPGGGTALYLPPTYYEAKRALQSSPDTVANAPIYGDVTLEGWANLAYTTDFCSMFSISGMYVIWYANIGVLIHHVDGQFVYALSNSTPDTWVHVAAVRSSGVVELYLDGVYQGSTPTAFADPYGGDGYGVRFGADNYFASYSAVGYYDDVMLTTGAKYTANFTPAARGSGTLIPSNADVTCAGYNTLDEITSAGAFNTQANQPDAYFLSFATLGDALGGASFTADANGVTFSGARTLANATNTGTFVGATPTNFSGTSTLDDATATASFYAGLPLEWSGSSALDDATQTAVYLFLAPSEFSASAQLAGNTGGASFDTITPPNARLTAALPTLRLTASGRPRAFAGGLITLPELTGAARGGHQAINALPMLTAVATGTTVAMARAIMTLPMLTAAGTGRTAGQSSLQATLPGLTVDAFGGHQAAMTLPAMTSNSSVTSGAIARVTGILPSLSVLASGHRDDTARVTVTLPMIVTTPSATARITLPAIQALVTGGAVLATTYEAYVMNMNQPLDDNPRNNFEAKIDQVTRYTNWPFIQTVRLGGTYYGVATDGLYELGGATDDGAAVQWAFETCKTDFRDAHRKAVASAYIGGQAGPTVTYTLRSGDDTDRMYDYTTTKVVEKRNHRQKFGLGRRVRYYSFGLAGEGKAAIDTIEFELLNTTRRI